MQNITSTTNPRIKQIVRLQTQPRQRRKANQFCVETHRELERALAAGYEMIELYVLESADDCDSFIDHADRTNAATFSVNETVLQKITYRQNPQNLLAVLTSPKHTLDGLPQIKTDENAKRNHSGVFVVCSGLEKPGNIGAILRSASGAGVAGVLIDAGATAPDLYNPNCLRASTGAVFSVPIACDTTENLIAYLNENNIPIIALTPEATTPYHQLDYTQGAAIALGSEADGLAQPWRDAAASNGDTVSIPMRGAANSGADSLNVSVAAAIVMFEATKAEQ